MWINVHDKLPPKNVVVLVYYGVGGMNVTDTDVSGQFSEKGYYKITHWMYLPKPPKSEAIDRPDKTQQLKVAITLLSKVLFWNEHGGLTNEQSADFERKAREIGATAAIEPTLWDHKMKKNKSKENVWERYEAEKQLIYATSKNSEEYTRRIAELAKRLGI